MHNVLTSSLASWVLALVLLAPTPGCGAEDHKEGPAPPVAGEAARPHPGEDEEHADGEGEKHGDGEDEEHAEHGEEGGEHEEELVRLSAEVLDEFDIEVEPAAAGPIVRRISLPAEVRPNQDRLAHIAPRFPGIVIEARKQIGESVSPGDVLAKIESSQSLAPYSLRSKIGGVVIAKHITRGEPVTRETQAFVVADLRDVWVDISVYQKDLHLVRIGQPVLVSAGHGFEEALGELSYISPVVDEETRTATARVVLPNPEGLWRPGMFVTASVEVGNERVSVVVPATAIERIDDHAVIFVSVRGGFEPRQVVLGRVGGGRVEVLSGLVAGEPYVSRGGFTLKAELARDELSGGHGH